MSDPDQTDFHLQLYWGALSFLHQSALLHFTWSEVTFGEHNSGVHNPISEDMPRCRFDYIMRAAMMGVPGFSYQLPKMPEWCRERLKELGSYYTAHATDFILNGDAYRLTPQPLTHGRGERFPVFEFVSRAGDAQVYAFRLSGAPEEQRVLLQGLCPEAEYRVRFVDSGEESCRSGRELASDGLVFGHLPEEASEITSVGGYDKPQSRMVGNHLSGADFRCHIERDFVFKPRGSHHPRRFAFKIAQRAGNNVPYAVDQAHPGGGIFFQFYRNSFFRDEFRLGGHNGFACRRLRKLISGAFRVRTIRGASLSK